MGDRQRYIHLPDNMWRIQIFWINQNLSWTCWFCHMALYCPLKIWYNSCMAKIRTLLFRSSETEGTDEKFKKAQIWLTSLLVSLLKEKRRHCIQNTPSNVNLGLFSENSVNINYRFQSQSTQKLLEKYWISVYI